MSASKTSNKQHQLKVNQLLADLQSGNADVVATALKAFSVHGDASIIVPVANVWIAGLSEENERLVIELLEGLKDTSTIEPLIEVYRNPKFSVIKRQLTSVFWNSKLDFSPYLSDFVLFAVEGDFLDAFEAITLVEQFETQVSESAVMESQLLLKEYFGGTENRSDQKDVILSDLAILIKQFEEEADMDDDLFLE